MVIGITTNTRRFGKIANQFKSIVVYIVSFSDTGSWEESIQFAIKVKIKIMEFYQTNGK